MEIYWSLRYVRETKVSALSSGNSLNELVTLFSTNILNIYFELEDINNISNDNLLKNTVVTYYSS